MSKATRLSRSVVLTALLAVTGTLQGCVSVQMSSGGEGVRLVGLGSAKPLDGANGRIYRIVAPGLSLRTSSYAPGLSLGWHETLLFYPLAEQNVPPAPGPVAVQTKCVGIELAHGGVMLGLNRRFAVPMPPPGSDVIQYISYSAENPTNAVIKRRELR